MANDASKDMEVMRNHTELLDQVSEIAYQAGYSQARHDMLHGIYILLLDNDMYDAVNLLAAGVRPDG